MVPRQQYVDLYQALSQVGTNGQAVAAADACLSALTQVRDKFSSWSIDAARRDAYKRLNDAVADVAAFADPLRGPVGDMQIAPGAWDDLSHAIGRAYNVMWAISDVEGDETEWGAFLAWVAEVVRSSVGLLASAVSGATGIAAKVVSGVAGGLVPLWPIAAVIVAVIAIVVLVAPGGAKALIP